MSKKSVMAKRQCTHPSPANMEIESVSLEGECQCINCKRKKVTRNQILKDELRVEYLTTVIGILGDDTRPEYQEYTV
ncbi:hypothetical protein HNY73_017560 [Argiope bruennichi]|uniref:Uncharacterized protein n=1 Tax=Argiope bruennichi TaxID=94029 RepID=A0A8T0EEW4_ARGBR|nr:hypothetical protein HNY73_017560 [Argiope bruennichi]